MIISIMFIVDWCIVFTLLFESVATIHGSAERKRQDDVLKCIPTGKPKRDVIVRKSELDERQYKYLTLDNQLRILLVSDRTVEISAASVSIHAGFANDPLSVPGLAHFLEHMLFLGTKKYPDAADFHNFLNQHGGDMNAHTLSELTVYYFSIRSEYLQPALDRFSQFFVAPLFDSNSTDREMNIVDQEHQKNYRNDYAKIDYIKRVGSKLGHPYGKFAGGNLETLKTIPQQRNIDIRKMLLKFYEIYYSANIMTVAVVGKESLDNLEKMVVPMFKEVKNRNTALVPYTFPYGESQMATMLEIPTSKEMNKLEIEFQLPDLRCFSRMKPLMYFSQVIAHEGEGSLTSQLKHLGWAHSLTAHRKAGLVGFEFFVIQVDLTKSGLERVDDIITILFQFLEMMRTTPTQSWIHDEILALDFTKLTFQEKLESRVYAMMLAENLQLYQPEHLIDGRFITGEFIKDKITELLEYFTPENLRCYIASNTLKGPWNRHAKYYDADYSEHKIPKWKLMKWRNVRFNLQFKYPSKNPFIPDPKELKVVVPRNNETKKKVPEIIKDNQMVRVWHKADDMFYTPKSGMLIGIYSPVGVATPSSKNHFVLFVESVRDSMTKFGVPAQLAGIQYFINAKTTGIEIIVYGFSSKQDVVLKEILNHVVAIKNTMQETKFNGMKQKLLMKLTNVGTQMPLAQTDGMLRYVMSETWWNADERLQYMNALTMNSLKEFIDTFLGNIYIEGIFVGNTLRSTALATFGVAETMLLADGPMPLLPTQHIRSREYKLREGKNYLFEKRSSIYSFSAVRIFFQVGLRTERNNVLCELFNNVIQARIFHTLRTKEQLGYLVSSVVYRSQSVVGIQILIQSEKEPSYVEKRVERFFKMFMSVLRDMPDNTFNTYIEAMAISKLKNAKNLPEEGLFYALEISRRQFHFRRNKKEVEILLTLKKKDLMEFFKEFIHPESQRRKRLTVVVLGRDATSLAGDEAKNWIVIDDILKLKTSLPLYEHVLPYNNITVASYKKKNKRNEL